MAPIRELKRILPATLGDIEAFCREFRAIAASIGERSDRFVAELLLREALTNALLHGCRSDPSRQISCIVRVRPRRLLIAVEDDGDGFDWRAVLQRQLSTSSCSGRGFEILRKYATRFRFNRSGNRTAIIRQF